jgi:hypothetical protein
MLVEEQRGYMILCAAATTQFSTDRSELETIAESFRLD